MKPSASDESLPDVRGLSTGVWMPRASGFLEGGIRLRIPCGKSLYGPRPSQPVRSEKRDTAVSDSLFLQRNINFFVRLTFSILPLTVSLTQGML